MTYACSTCSCMMLTTLYEICIILSPLKRIMLIYLAFKHIHCVHFIWCTFCISTYAPASYRIANREPGRHTRGARGAARGAAAGSDRSRRGGRWETSGVPRSSPELLRERQALEHFFLPVCNDLIKCFTLIDALRSGVVCNRCCIIPCLPLLYYILVTLVPAVESMLSWLRPVEVGWFPVTCEL